MAGLDLKYTVRSLPLPRLGSRPPLYFRLVGLGGVLGTRWKEGEGGGGLMAWWERGGSRANDRVSTGDVPYA